IPTCFATSRRLTPCRPFLEKRYSAASRICSMLSARWSALLRRTRFFGGLVIASWVRAVKTGAGTGPDRLAQRGVRQLHDRPQAILVDLPCSRQRHGFDLHDPVRDPPR